MFEEKNSNNSRKKNAADNKRGKYIRNSSNSKRIETPVKRQYVSRRIEVYGIVIMMVSVILCLSFFSFGRPGLITGYINDFLSYVFGFTKYFFAFFLFVWGISFFIRRVKYLPSRFGWGLALFYISVSGLLSNNFKYADIFDPLVVRSRGGIIGAGIFYGLYRLVGKAGAITILIALIIIGLLIITRLSIIDIARKIRMRRMERRNQSVGQGVLIKDNSAGKVFNGADMLSSKKSGSDASGKMAGTPGYNALNNKFIPDGRMPEIISYEDKGKQSRVFDGEKSAQRPGNMEDSGSGSGSGGSRGSGRDGVGSNAFESEAPKRQPSSAERDTGAGNGKDRARQLSIPLIEDQESDENYKLPPLSLLRRSEVLSPKLYKQNVSESVNTLNQLFYHFNLPAKITSVTRGPSITLYEVTLSQGIKVSKLLALEDDFCVALGTPDLRFLTPIPGRSAIGIEVPNKIRSLVTLGDIFSGNDKELDELLALPLGKNFSGDVVHIAINNMPHLLIAGATNSGKSVCLNSIIVSLLMKVKPSQVRFIMIDPKMVELTMYDGIPHLLAPVIVDPKKAASVLSWALEEMKNRLQILRDYNCKKLEEFNFMVKRDYNKDADLKQLPYILIVIDELADLMMVSAAEVENSICRIAQMARAVGIHLIISTQKPVVKILTGLIKTNIPARIAFKVTDFTDSRTILEHGGAEKLIGKGDMLYLSPQGGRPERLQGAFLATREINLVTNYIKSQGKANYNPEITERFVKKEEKSLEDDDLLYEALRVVVEIGHASASLLQRKLRLGYSRAARIIDQLQDKGFISGPDGSKPREVQVSKEELEDMLGESGN
jgi:DNA segregation ATPase FtsK/SpoIIIE, S-DNA-T family